MTKYEKLQSAEALLSDNANIYEYHIMCSWANFTKTRKPEKRWPSLVILTERQSTIFNVDLCTYVIN